MKRVSLLAVLALAFVGGAPQADAANLYSDVVNYLDISLYENLYNVDGSTGTLDADNVADVGDLLVGVFNINTILSSEGLWNSTATDQLTGLFVQQVYAVNDGPGGSKILTLGTYSGVTPLETITFQDTAGGTFTVSLPTGAMFVVYEDSSTQLNPLTGTDASTLADATDGSLWLSLGFGAESNLAAGELYYDEIGTSGTYTVSGTAFASMSVLDNNTGYLFGDIGETATIGGVDTTLYGQVVLSANFNTNIYGGPWNVEGNDPGRILPYKNVIPEPASMLMLGMGLGGLGLVSRRRKA